MKRVILVTGCNRGIGKRIAEILVEKYYQNNVFIFTQRQKQNEELKNALQKINPKADFEIQQLDIVSKDSRRQLIEWLRSKYNKVDVIYNNAGVIDHSENFEKRSTKKIVDHTFQANFFSTLDFTEELYPLLSEDGRIIFTSSEYGKLSMQPEEGKKLLSDEKLITKKKLIQIANEYLNNVEDSSKDLIFSPFSYCLSKALINSYMRFVATKYIKAQQSVFSVDPGWVKTDMGGEQAPLTTDQACPCLAYLAAQIPYGRHPFNGKFLFDNKIIEF